MEDKKILVESLFEKIKEYLKTNADLLKLKLIEKISEAFSNLAVFVGILLVFSMFFLFLNIGAAFWIGALLGETYLGFLIVAGFYLLLTLVFLIAYKPIKRSIADSTIRHFLK